MPTQGSGQLGDMGQGADATPGRRAHQRKQSKDQREGGAPKQQGAVAVAGGKRQKQGANQPQPSPEKEMADPAGCPLGKGNHGRNLRATPT